MTFREYENLQIGDRVILPFSSDAHQIVINAESDMVETKPVGTAHNQIIYRNHYDDIELYKSIDEAELEELAYKCATDYYGFDNEWEPDRSDIEYGFKMGYRKAKEE